MKYEMAELILLLILLINSLNLVLKINETYKKWAREMEIKVRREMNMRNRLERRIYEE